MKNKKPAKPTAKTAQPAKATRNEFPVKSAETREAMRKIRAAHNAAKKPATKLAKAAKLIKPKKKSDKAVKPRSGQGKAKSPSLKPHPLAACLPMMSDAELAALKTNIATTGYRVSEPGVVYEGKLLDGRNRQKACIELGISFPTRDFDPAIDGTPLDFVYTRACHRNLTDSQKACAAVEFLPHFKEANRQRMSDGGKSKGSELVPTLPGKLVDGKSYDQWEESLADLPLKPLRKLYEQAREAGTKEGLGLIDTILSWKFPAGAPVIESREQAGQLFGVSGRYVDMARELKEGAPDLFQLAFNGDPKHKITVARRIMRSRNRTASIAKQATLVGRNYDPAEMKIDTGDSLDVMPTIPNQSIRLIVTDPRYNIGIDYGNGEQADAMTDAGYLNWCEMWMEECVRVLTPDGTLVIIINDEYAAEYVVALKRLGLHQRAWIKWYETFGVNCSNNFNRTSRHILYFTKSQTDFVFDPLAFSRHSARQVLYNDNRAAPAGKLWDDVWVIPRLVENSGERIPDVPTQLPLALIQPIVQGLSEPGDKVLDPFCGSGTTPAACVLTGRHCRAIEINPKYADLARLRLQGMQAEKEEKVA